MVIKKQIDPKEQILLGDRNINNKNNIQIDCKLILYYVIQ